MNNLYNRIYEAIDTGIQKALIISNDQSQDASICWKEKEISGNINDSIMKDLAANFLNNDKIQSKKSYDKNLYIQLKTIYENTGCTYKPKSKDEFHDIIYASQNIAGINALKVDYRWLDMSDYVMAITYSGQEIPLHAVNGQDVKYLKFMLPKYNKYTPYAGHPIIIHKDLLIQSCQWHKQLSELYNHIRFNDLKCRKYSKYPDHPEMVAANDYDGYDNTYNNLNIYDNDYSNNPAFEYVMSLSDVNYEGYLPAAGELIIIWSNLQFIIACLNMFRDKNNQIDKYFNQTKDTYFWTSTEFDNERSNDLKMSKMVATIDKKTYELPVFPMFKKKGDTV